MKKYLQYIVILLDDTSVSFCHANNPIKEKNLIPLETLREAITFSMKQNLMIQFVYPDYDLPKEYCDLIETIDHVKVGKDVLVYDYVPLEVKGKNSESISNIIEKYSKVCQIQDVNIHENNIDNIILQMYKEYEL